MLGLFDPYRFAWGRKLQPLCQPFPHFQVSPSRPQSPRNFDSMLIHIGEAPSKKLTFFSDFHLYLCASIFPPIFILECKSTFITEKTISQYTLKVQFVEGALSLNCVRSNFVFIFTRRGHLSPLQGRSAFSF